MKINRENYFGAKGGGPRPAFAEKRKILIPISENYTPFHILFSYDTPSNYILYRIYYLQWVQDDPKINELIESFIDFRISGGFNFFLSINKIMIFLIILSKNMKAL